MHNTILSTAFDRYASMGACLFPLRPGTKLPFKDFHWKEQASHNPFVWREWATTCPDCNWALHLGRSGLVVVDVDVKKVGVEKAREAYLELAKRGGLPPIDKPHVSTPSGGWHYYLKAPNDVADLRTVFLAGCIELRAGNAYVVVPPSVIGESAYNVAH